MSNIPPEVRKFEKKYNVYTRYSDSPCQIIKKKKIDAKIIFYKNTKKQVSIVLDKDLLFKLCHKYNIPFDNSTSLQVCQSGGFCIGKQKINVSKCIATITDLNTKTAIEIAKKVNQKQEIANFLNSDGSVKINASSYTYYEPNIETEYYDKIWEDKESKIDYQDAPHNKRKTKVVNNCSQYPRNPLYAKIALEKANFLCEINPQHITFPKKGTTKQFVEAHHLIPIQFHDKFDISLDVPANIISLCPNCHKNLHYGEQEKVELLLIRLLKERKNRLAKSSINISPEHLLQMYNAK